MDQRESFNMLFRYLIIVLAGLPNLFIFYAVFTPLTVYPAYWILHLFYSASLAGSTLSLAGTTINLISACIAGAAYYLLFAVNLSTPMSFNTRIKSLAFMFLSLLLLNIVRIVLFALLFVAGCSYFDLAHKTVWYLGSTILVVVIWFVTVEIFDIKSIPAYTDLKNLMNDIPIRKNKR